MARSEPSASCSQMRMFNPPVTAATAKIIRLCLIGLRGLLQSFRISRDMSSLLDDIINLAIDGKQPLPDILRRCLLLGHDLKNERLRAWANQELNGYDSTNGLPDYRVVLAGA